MRFTSMTHKGGQNINKDCFARICRDGIFCFVMSDGVGVGGDKGARTVADAVLREFESAPSVTKERAADCIKAAMSAFDAVIVDDPLYENMTATAAVLITDGEKAVCAHIGDTRIYMFRKGLINFITSDHTEAMEEYAAGRIAFSELRNFGSSARTRIIANGSAAEPETDGIFKITDKTAFLICTDGFWMNINESNMELALRRAHSSKTWLGDMMLMLEETTPSDCGNLSAAAIIM